MSREQLLIALSFYNNKSKILSNGRTWIEEMDHHDYSDSCLIT